MVADKRPVVNRILIALVVLVVLVVGAAVWYVNDFYHADDVALVAVADENGASDGVEVRELPNGSLAFVPDRPKAGLVFYPGGKVQPEAYAPLMRKNSPFLPHWNIAELEYFVSSFFIDAVYRACQVAA